MKQHQWRVTALIDSDDPELAVREVTVSASTIWNAIDRAWRGVLGPEHDKRRPKRDEQGRLYREPEITAVVRLKED